METNGDQFFDKLDHKVFVEMPFMIDVIASWGNKIARFFDPIAQEMETILENELKGKRYWYIESSDRKIFYPFTEGENILKGYFEIDSYYRIEKKINGVRWKHYFILECGYRLQTEKEEDSDKANEFFFRMGKGEDYKKYGGVLMPLEFYFAAKQKMDMYDIEIMHPQNGDREEWFKVKCHELDPEKINTIFNEFKKIILQPILRELK